MIAVLMASSLMFAIFAGALGQILALFVARGLVYQKPLKALLSPLDLAPTREITASEATKEKRARRALESRYSSGTKAIEGQRKKAVARQASVPVPAGMSLPEEDLKRLEEFARHVEATRVEAEKSGDAEWLREVLTLRNRLAENVQAFTEASAGGIDDGDVSVFHANIRHMEQHLQGLLSVRIQDARKKLRTLTSYYENKVD